MTAYVNLDLQAHGDTLGRQFIMWTVMLVSPTPGSSGTAELVFQQLYGATLGEYTLFVDFLWRLLTYYTYLMAGIILSLIHI